MHSIRWCAFAFGLNSVEPAAAVAAGELEAALVVLPIDDGGLKVTPLLRGEVHYVSADPDHVRRAVTMEQFCRSRLVLYDTHCGWKDPAVNCWNEHSWPG